MGTVLAMSELTSEGGALFFDSSLAVDAADSGDSTGGRGGAAIARVGNGDVFEASALTSAARETFLVGCVAGESGEEVAIEMEFGPMPGVWTGAVGSIRRVRLVSVGTSRGSGSSGGSCWRRGRCITPGGAAGACLGGSGVPLGRGRSIGGRRRCGTGQHVTQWEPSRCLRFSPCRKATGGRR